MVVIFETYLLKLVDEGIYDDSNMIHAECLRFLFSSLIQDGLSKIKQEWNQYRIRPVWNSECSAGRPNIWHYTVHENDKLSKVSREDVLLTQDYYQYKFPCGCKQEFVEVALIYINELELNLPGNVEEAETLYVQLVNAI